MSTVGDLSEQTAAVVGAGRGLGRATALALARHGASVVIASRTKAELDAVGAEIAREGGRARALVADAALEENAQYIIDGALDFGGRLDLLVVCAGAALIKPIPEVTLAEWEHVFAMNARSVFLTNRAALGPMLAGGRGLIVNVASRAGITGAPNVTAYTAAKAAVIGFSRALAMEMKPKGIRVACLAPGPMDTPMRWAATPDFDPARLISTDAVADLIVYLARRADVTLDDPVVPVSIRL
jgi:NAD(P)-dependent dehydrogenase (short-subunit alcohol dehydrogenase family)